MNIYLMVEGYTESIIYPCWFSYLLPNMKKIKYYDEVTTDSYYLFNACGYPSIIYTHLKNAINEVNSIGKYDYLVICFDADEDDVQERKEMIDSYLDKEKLYLNLKTKLEVIVQNRCIETWLLGNRKIFKRNPNDRLLARYVDFYDVSIDDPELMGKFDDFREYQQFHKAYFKALCREREIRYSEKAPGDVIHKSYFEQLLYSVNQTKHLKTFCKFINFCKKVRKEPEMECK